MFLHAIKVFTKTISMQTSRFCFVCEFHAKAQRKRYRRTMTEIKTIRETYLETDDEEKKLMNQEWKQHGDQSQEDQSLLTSHDDDDSRIRSDFQSER